jgi:hypothetical protein
MLVLVLLISVSMAYRRREVMPHLNQGCTYLCRATCATLVLAHFEPDDGSNDRPDPGGSGVFRPCAQVPGRPCWRVTVTTQ